MSFAVGILFFLIVAGFFVARNKKISFWLKSVIVAIILVVITSFYSCYVVSFAGRDLLLCRLLGF
ncbi:hypothetical protein HYV91_02820 [Candidatus Wolfebacteria bacterium]|nr:hypothetical protein [Candidatus Wolfebacteria bacterium]